ncbi:SRPBCC family protein [Pseudosulfitobacter pseudonitzschiae]|uniref:SRPBCC family protein n=1 Tax=Pseudosulfitobacter pseudonitzschiae TaxID=1402135 RepID=UPI001AF3F250|nr:SRPBCC family protein [Pseudosulfitobacter pseudonitzschiae]MBM1816336.1 SRPBCC family protein [Pseudosulfitobacter pseudonitzschiae]MBM1833849.1 SRPBCC family protein [Pseudosulfitobacter pseudonitzschiae]MBM1838715.1 SRPBCC family protein [Pseudosulfitobacter pseudonitzschiae]MBM1843063.1 SRPBCC family protein [Pseudosulfitobacter pseudonitzschiae]MBM1847929.1 SRPBCC family protein [Pseudosulfitobacter pseudonitzschiae]
MELKFSVAGRISKPVDDVFEAVVSPDSLSQYFTTGGAKGRLETGAEVTWDFHDFPGAFPVLVQEVVQNEKIVLQWEADQKTATWTTVTMEFTPLDGNRTLVRISEHGWPETEAGLGACLGNCEGWTGMLCAMKAWMEHGINLRDGYYK